MTHLSEEELILYYYGETAEPGAVEQHLAACEVCRAGYQWMQTVLNSVSSLTVPEKSPEYGTEVWQRIGPQIAPSLSRSLAPSLSRLRGSWRRWAAVAAMAGLIVAAYLAGRLSPTRQTPQTASSAPQVRERILLVAVGDHLERSQMVLVELANAESSKGKLDISEEQRYATDLVEANRLYRQTASTTGDTALATVLEDLERVLLDVANGNSQLSSQELEEIRRRIESQGLLFKMRVVESQIRERENDAANPPAKHNL